VTGYFTTIPRRGSDLNIAAQEMQNLMESHQENGSAKRADSDNIKTMISERANI